MKFAINFLLTSLAAILFSTQICVANQDIKTLSDLLTRVKQDQIEQVPKLKKRELKFLKARNSQRSLLGKAKAELQKEEKIMAALQANFDKQEKHLSELESRLTLVMGTLGELFGVVRQTARGLKNQFDNSIISAEYKNRSQFLDKVARQKQLASTPELEKLWFLLHQEMTETGKVTKFDGEIVKNNGDKETRSIVRVGSFNLISKKEYLNYEPETSQIVQFPKKVGGRHASLINNLENSKTKYQAFGLDPSRGSLLALFMQSPSLTERINQGGLVGYIIILLLLFAIGLSIKRFLELRFISQGINLQMASQQVLENNPLGDIKKIFQMNQDKDIETLELKMDEAISRKTSQVQKGLSTIKILASIAPLLGLLGTVTGMIATFQSITLFGTGDPKLMAGGISQALVTTVLGLVAAIPLILIYNYLSSQAKNIVQIFENESLGLLSEQSHKKQD